MKNLGFLWLCAGTLALAGCQTWEGIQRDVGKLDMPSFSSSPPAQAPVDERADAFVQNADCPQIEVVEELRTLPADGGGARLALASSACTYAPKSVTVDLTLSVSGSPGPSVPQFFVAVTDPGGDIMAKEVFTAQIGSGSHTESLRQIIPIPDRSRGPKYKVLAGFQLTKDQLAYNRAEIQRIYAEKRAAEEAAKQAAKAAAKSGGQAVTTQPAQPAQIIQKPGGVVVIPDNGQPVPLTPP